MALRTPIAQECLDTVRGLDDTADAPRAIPREEAKTVSWP